MMSAGGILKKSTDYQTLVESDSLTQSSDRVKLQHVVRFTNPQWGSPADLQSGDGEIIFNIINWNTHNCDLFKEREEISKLKGHILIFQEVNKQMWERSTGLGYKWYIKKRNDKSFILNNMVAKRREDLESLNSLVIQIFFRNSSIFIGSIHQTLDKTEFRTLLSLLQPYPLILGGDLNIQIRSMNVNGFKWIAVRKDPSKKLKNNFSNFNQKKQKQIDYIFYNPIFRIEQKQIMAPQSNNQPLSDHNPIEMQLRMNEDIRMEFPFFNQQNAREILKQNIDTFKTIMEMTQYSNNQIPSIKIVKFEIPNCQNQNDEYKLKLQKMLTENKKKYHQIIKHTSNIGKQTQGMIINILDQGNGQFITNYKQINSECINQIMKISDRLESQSNRIWKYQEQITYLNIGQEGYEHLEIPDLQVTPAEEKKKQNKKIGYFKYNWPMRGDKYEFYNKAISYDWTHLSIIREMWERSQRQDFSFMNLTNLRKLKYTLQMRIIPINKVSPCIPNKEQMRPIIVMSHVIKMIELFYEERLKEYVSWQINPEQIGFVKGMGTPIHIQEVIRYLKIKGMKGKTAIFIDLSNAYNVVNRERLYEILRNRRLFGENALNFLFSLYDELYFWDEWKKEKTHIKNGLHQGSILSPYLFDIYFDDLIQKWKQKMKQQELMHKIRNKKKLELAVRNARILAYADDVVFLNNKDASAKEFNFQINLKKTNFLSKTKNQALIQMGVWINVRGSIKHHYQILKKIVKKNSWRVKSLSKLLPARHIFKLWQIYVKPYFDYISTALWLQKQPMVKQFQQLWRSCIRIMSGMHRSFTTSILEDMFGQISFFGDDDKFLLKQEENNLNRWINQERRNLQIYYQKNQEKIDTQNENYLKRIQPIESNIEKYIQKMKVDLKRKRLGVQIQRWSTQPLKEDVPQWNSNVIRKIPNYHFFNLFRYESMLCKLCKKSLTIQHIDSHFGTEFDRARNQIMFYITSKKAFNKVDQKVQNNHAFNVSKQLDKLAQTICEKRVYIKKNPK